MEITWKATLFQYGTAFSAGLSAMAAGAWLAWPSSAIQYLQSGEEGFTLENDQISTLVALMDFGNILSPVPSSYLMNAIGRKMTLLTTAAMYIASSLFAIFGNHVYMLYTARFLAGLGKGVAFAVVPIFLAEIANVQIRGALSTMFIGLLNIGMVYDYVIGPFVSYSALNLINLIIPVAFLLSFTFLPESPYYMLMKGREDPARNCLRKYRGVRKLESGPGTPLDEELKKMAVNVENDMKNRGRFVDLLATKGRRRALGIIIMLALFQRSSGISPTLAYSTIFMPKHGGGASPAVYMIIFSMILVVANFLATPIVDTMGRKALLLVSSFSSAIVMGMAGVFYYFTYKTDVDVSSYLWVPYFCLIAFAVTYSLGVGFIPSTLVGELFPTNVKSYAGSVSAIILAATSFVVNKVFQGVSDQWGVHVMYAFFSISMILNFIYVIFCVFETKGKTFSEIQDILNEKNE